MFDSKLISIKFIINCTVIMFLKSLSLLDLQTLWIDNKFSEYAVTSHPTCDHPYDAYTKSLSVKAADYHL